MARALFHAQFDIVQRSKGQHAVKVAAYNSADRYTAADGAVYDFRRKVKEHQGHAVMLPDGAPMWARDSAELWRRAESAEKRADAQTARLVQFSIPREVPPEQRMAFAQAVVAPWVKDGMAAQVDIHCPPAADGQQQPHAHVTLSMRRFDGRDFAARKERQWNQAFQADKGRDMRGEIADRMNAWLEAHGLDSRVDHRTAAAQGDPTPPERDVPKRSWETWKAQPDHPAAAPVRETLDARPARQQLRRARAVERQAADEIRAIGQTIEARQPGVTSPRRKRRREPWKWDETWTPEIRRPVEAFTVEAERRRAVLSLTGGAIVDRGDRLTIQGKTSDQAVAVLADQAARHGWKQVAVTGSLADRDKIAAALKVRGIEAANVPAPSRSALRAAQRQLDADRRDAALRAQAAAERAVPAPAAPAPRPSPVPKPKPRPAPEPTPTPGMAAAPRPSWAVPPWARPPGSRKDDKSDRREG